MPLLLRAGHSPTTSPAQWVCVLPYPGRGNPPHLGLLLLRGIHDGGTAHLCQLTALAIKGPAADLVTNDILDEEHAAVEAQGELVKQLDVFQQVVVRVAEKTMRAKRPGNEVPVQGRVLDKWGPPLPPFPHPVLPK